MIRAIIVDDEPAVAGIISHFIQREHLPVEIVGKAEDGAQALKLIREKKPQLVFLDIQMPVLNGFDVMKAAPESGYIIITAYESFEYAQQALRLGASDILLKPLEYKQFLQAITRTVGWNFTGNGTVNSILEYIHDHYAEKIELNQLSQLFYATPSHISRLFKKYMDVNIVTYIHKVRIEKAQELLLERKCSIKETAEMVGYESLNNFYKYFKQYTDKTPAAFCQEQGVEVENFGHQAAEQ
ncbi:response regulator transcription factor [Bacilliculturomica massiliensis]|uniref:response regulator transcription factor n=1 Tax=Bacilliculturomica massiliensis TaxID=1917867 RepID=UPI001031439C|nr:response regulator [Bacilliculturomica massiliensis]